MEPARLRLGELLVDARIITREQLENVLQLQKGDGRRLGTLLVEQGLVNETQVTQILSQQLSVPWVSLYHVDFSKRLLGLVPSHVAQKYCLIPIYVRHVRGQGDTLYVAMDDPTNLDALRECASWSGLPTRAMIASPADIRHAIEIYYGVAAPASSSAETVREGALHPRPYAPPSDRPDPVQPAQPARPDEPAADEMAPPEPEEKGAGEAHAPSDAETPKRAEPEAASVSIPKAQDDEISVEVGEELSLDELLKQQKPSEPEPTTRPRGRSKSGKLMSLTLLDGTTLALPMPSRQAKRKESLVGSLTDTRPGPEEVVDEHLAGTDALQVRDILAALRAAAHGVDASEALGRHAKWEAMLAVVLAILIRKGVITEDELLEEMRKI
jgi:type IV pilus assembly protein PilB